MDDVETRTVMTLRTGTKVCVLIGLGLVVLAVYFFIVPITTVRTTSGAVFGCGTALHPSHGSFADGVCGQTADVNRLRAIATLAAAVLTIVLGGLMFGADRREEQRRVPREDDYFRGDRRRDEHDREAWDREDRDERGADRADNDRSDVDPEQDKQDVRWNRRGPRAPVDRQRQRVDRYDTDGWARDDDRAPAHRDEKR